MEHVYQQRIETVLSRALPDVAFYLVCGLTTGSILEYIMPYNEEDKDSVALILEVFAQIALLVFSFMLIHTKGGGRNGLIVYILSIIGTQPTLFDKINSLREKVFDVSKSKVQDTVIKVEDTTVESQQNNESEDGNVGATSISNLPQM